MGSKSRLHSLRAQAEYNIAIQNQLKLDFIAAELNISLTFISLAWTASEMEHFEASRRLQARAALACAEAEKRIAEAEARGANVRELRRFLQRVIAALEKLPS